MWWLDPGKEVLNVLFNRILAPYIENLDMNQVTYGIGQGQLTLKNLRLKKGALDKFRLPVDVLEGHLGTFTLSLHWMNLGNQPVEVLIENIYLLVVPSSQGNLDPEEEERRAQDAKAERLRNAELLHMPSERDQSSDESQKSEGLLASLTAKIINNLQVKVKNIHVRYEDKLSVPGHPFAAGLTLSEFSAVSTNSDWIPAFIESTAGSIHKLANLKSLAIYVDTDSESLSGLPLATSIVKFTTLISTGEHISNHQFVLKPVSGEGRIIMNHKLDKDTPQFDVQLLFDDIGVLLDDNQYRDAISLVDMYHFYTRQRQYRKYRPSDEELQENRPMALLEFAGRTILDGIREKHRQWTWAYFAERRDDRKKYVDLFKKSSISTPSPEDVKVLQGLERKLSYEDIRFYRSIARSQLRKDLASRKKLEEDKQKHQPQSKGGWLGWVWGSSSSSEPATDPFLDGNMTDQQRKELYDVLDYDEKAALAESFEAPRDALKARVAAKLNKGSLALKTDPHGAAKEVISVAFDVFQANFLQRPGNIEATISLGGFGVLDSTTPGTLYPQIVHVKENQGVTASVAQTESIRRNAVADDPFFFLKFENNPLDERADNALTVRMRHMEIVYHKGYVEAVYKFFKPPESQLESVEALLTAASETLEGLQKETRAGLEYALQTHKTIDIQMDMNAPLIIVPEDVRTKNCRHLVIDAGHIAIESELADKKALRDIQSKRNQQYTDDDFKRLESLMYDKLTLKLHDAQFLIGNDLASCRDALNSSDPTHLHLLERINIDLSVQNSIVPTAVNIPRFKISGNLPTLQVNVSDTKYQTLIRLIDVAMPKFGDESELKTRPPISRLPSGHPSAAFPLSQTLFGQSTTEYNVHDDDGQNTQGNSEDAGSEGQFFDAETGTERRELHQHTFEFDFRVDLLRACIFKSTANGMEKPLGDVSLDCFQVDFALAKFDMKVNVSLRSLSMSLVHRGMDPLLFISSTKSTPDIEQVLLKVAYTRVQKASPEFLDVYEGIDQSVDMKLSTFIFQAAPEPVLALYDFVMTTFVPNKSTTNAVSAGPNSIDDDEVTPPSALTSSDVQVNGKIRVTVNLASVQVILVDGTARLATLSLSTANAALLLRENTLLVNARLGGFALSDDSAMKTSLPSFKQIMSIEGQEFAEFRYQTYDPSDKDSYTGIKSSVYLKAASIKFTFLEQPLHDIYRFAVKFAKLKGLYDAASQVAVQKASEIERMIFNISVSSPIVVVPADAVQSEDVLTMRLGEIGARNDYEGPTNKISASLRGIQLASTIFYGGKPSLLRIIDDTDITADILQTSDINRQQGVARPDTEAVIKISDVKFHLTQVQYGLLIALSQSIPKVLAGAPEGSAQAEHTASSQYHSSGASNAIDSSIQQTSVDLQPELRPSLALGQQIWTTLDLMLTVNAVKCHLYDHLATSEANIKDRGIARFALNNTTLRGKILSDGALEGEALLKSFTMSNIRAGGSRFREIIPAAQHDRNQFMVLYTASAADKSALAVVTIDSPKIIFAIDPVIALLTFFTSPFKSTEALNEQDSPVELQTLTNSPPNSMHLDFRLDLHDVSVSILENDVDPETQAIWLSVKQVLLSQQAIMAITISELGMSLMRMGKNDESVRFLDDTDLTLSLDSRSSSQQQMTSIEVTSRPVVFRASYRDINLITSIVSKAVELYSDSSNGVSDKEGPRPSGQLSQRRVSSAKSHSSRPTKSRSLSMNQPKILLSREQFNGSFDGFSFVLIGDLHEQPMLHLKTKPFIVGLKDWSGDLQATTTIAAAISYWNLANSHWEPLIDPWTFTISIAKDGPSSGISATISAQKRLDLNISTSFIELAISTVNMWGIEGQHVLKRARGSYAPYRIHNRTGCSVQVWSDVDGSDSSKNFPAVQISNDQAIDWRFDDWKTMREHVSSSGQNCIGIQFVGKSWESLRSIPVDREGEYTFSLRPKTEKYSNRLLCEITVQDNVKVVTLRSTYKIENQTLYTLEVTLVDNAGHPVYSLEKIAPGQDFSLPIEAVAQNRIRLQPDQGFGYKWSPPIRWEDLLAKQSFTIKCPHNDEKEAAFRFQACAQIDLKDPAARKYPKLSLKLRAPIELENLLPYNVQYRIYDKDSNQNWSSYLRNGGIMPVHSVELGHLILLNIVVQDAGFKPSEFAIISTDRHSDFDIERQISLRDSSDRKLDLKLNYVHYPDSGGAFKVQIYSPYLVVNKTGLPFVVRSVRSARAGPPKDVAGETRLDILSKPSPFMLSHPHDKGHEFVFKIDCSMWSKTVSFEAPTADTEIVIPSQSRKSEEIHVGFSWIEGLGKYKLTKVITLAPRFLIKNNLSETICFREHGVAPGDRSTIKPGDRCPLHVMRVGNEKLLTVAYPGLNAQWSAPITIQDIGSMHFRLRGPEDSGEVHLIRADVKIEASTIFILLARVHDWPFAIENLSDYAINFSQTDDGRLEGDAALSKGSPKYTVKPHSIEYYAWDSPAAKGKKILLTINGANRVVDIMEIGDLFPFKFAVQQSTRAVSLDVRADNRTQVLGITNYQEELSLYKLKRRTTSSSRQDSTSSSHEVFEAVTEEITATLAVNIDLEGIGISLINRKLVEVVYLSVKNLKFEYADSPVSQAANLSCGVLQIDNQLHDGIFPVVLQPTPIPSDSHNAVALPTVQASLIWLKDQAHGVLFVKYCSILLQAITIQADEDFLFAVYDLTKLKGVSWNDDEQENVLIQHPEEISEPQEIPAGEDLYFEVLELQPIRVSLSFMRTDRVSGDERLSLRNPLAVVVNALTMTLGNVNDAPLEFNSLAIKDMRLTAPDLQARVMYHYRQEVLRQLYRILGSADFIGNPVGLFTNVSSGIADVFYEPLNGVVMHGNKELGIGIAKGAASFVKKTVFGVTDSMTKFSSSVGKGLSAATFDTEYQNRRRINQRRNKPRHAIYGVTAGAEALATSFASGMEGVVMKPIEGAESEGALGFFKGVGKGLVGAVTKPVVGVFDLAANVTEGIRNTTTVFDNPERDRARVPRLIPADGVLKPYSQREALGQFWMKDLDQGTYRKELYVAHINLPGNDSVVLLTTSRVLSFWSTKLRLDWDLPFTHVQGVTIEDTGIRFAHKAGTDQDRFVFIPDKSSQTWFFNQVASVVKSFNAQRRLEK